MCVLGMRNYCPECLQVFLFSKFGYLFSRFFGARGEIIINELLGSSKVVLETSKTGRGEDIYKVTSRGAHSAVSIRGNSGDTIKVVEASTRYFLWLPCRFLILEQQAPRKGIHISSFPEIVPRIRCEISR